MLKASSAAEPDRTCSWTYLLECADGSLYCGWTTDLKKRVETHNKGKGARYTRVRIPVRLVYAERFDTPREAMRREYMIKQMTRADKLRLIENAYQDTTRS